MGMRDATSGVTVIGGGTSVPAAVNSRLVAAAQTRAGARCHEAAGLIQHYYYQLYLYRQADGTDPAQRAFRRAGVEEAEAALRRFLAGARRAVPLRPALALAS